MQNVVYGEIRKQVTFRLDNPDEREAYELSKRINFSAFVRKALMDELQRLQREENRDAGSTVY